MYEDSEKKIDAGMKIFDFSLPDQDGKTHTNADFLGRWFVLYFYPKDATSGCTSEARDFAALHERFESLDCEVVGVSPDSVKKHANFAKKESLPFTLLADTEKTLIGACGFWVKKKLYGREYMGVQRSTLLIDPSGTVASLWEKVKIEGHAEEVLARLIERRGK